MKNNALTLALLCVFLFLINSCKTDPKVDPTDTSTVELVPENMTVTLRQRAEVRHLNPLVTYYGDD